MGEGSLDRASELPMHANHPSADQGGHGSIKRGGGRGFGSQKVVNQKWADEIFPLS